MYRADIDGLRAVAVLSVIFYHFQLGVPQGHFGVDIFFVISGFVISQALLSRNYLSLRQLLSDFYQRRLKRLLPALLLCIIVTSMLSVLLVNPKHSLSDVSLITGIYALFGLANAYLWYQNADYFSPDSTLNPFTHTWSLGVEEQFYVFFPLLVWAFFHKHPPAQRGKLLWVIGLLSALSLLGFLWVSHGYYALSAFYLMPLRFWELGIGVIAFLLWSKNNKINQKFADYITLLIAIILFVILVTPELPAVLSRISVVLLTAMLMVLLQPGLFIHRVLSFKPLVFIGLISYSLYLWHWSVLTVSRWTIGLHDWLLPIQFSIIFTLALLSYFYLEKPLRAAKASAALVFGFGLGSIAVTLAFLGLLLLIKPMLYTGEQAVLAKTGINSLREAFFINGIQEWGGQNCAMDSLHEAPMSVEDCTLGDFDHPLRRFLVVGNSFTAAQMAMYPVLLDNNLGSVTVTASWGAAPVPGMTKTITWGKTSDYYWGTIVPGLLAQLKAGDVIIMVSDSEQMLPKMQDERYQRRLEEFAISLRQFIEKAKEKGLLIVYQDALPFMREARCTPDTAIQQWWHFSREPNCNYYSREETLARRQGYSAILRTLDAEYANFIRLDLMDLFCPGQVCNFFSGHDKRVFLYRDEHAHPSVEAAILAQPWLLQTVTTLLKEQPEAKP